LVVLCYSWLSKNQFLIYNCGSQNKIEELILIYNRGSQKIVRIGQITFYKTVSSCRLNHENTSSLRVFEKTWIRGSSISKISKKTQNQRLLKKNSNNWQTLVQTRSTWRGIFKYPPVLGYTFIFDSFGPHAVTLTLVSISEMFDIQSSQWVYQYNTLPTDVCMIQHTQIKYLFATAWESIIKKNVEHILTERNQTINYRALWCFRYLDAHSCYLYIVFFLHYLAS